MTILILGYEFKDVASCLAAYNEIRQNYGAVVTIEADQLSLSISCDGDIAVKAGDIALKHGGKEQDFKAAF